MGIKSAESILEAIQTHAKRWAPLIRGPGLERQLADEIEYFIVKELKLPKRSYKRLGDNVCVQLGKPGNVHIAVVAHLDARLDQGAPLAVTAEGLSGAGASDVLAPLTMMSLWLEQVHGKNYDFQVSMLWLAGEHLHFKDHGVECVMQQLKHFESIDFALVVAPTNNQLALGSLGSIDTSIHFEGSPSITAVPWQGQDAIQMATPVLQTVADWPSRMAEHKGLHFHEGLCVTMMRGGQAPNLVPQSAELRLNARVAPSHEAEDAIEQMLTQLESAVAPYPLTVHDVRPPSSFDASHPVIRHIEEYAHTNVVAFHGSSVAAHFERENIATAHFGPGDPSHSGTHDALVRFDEILHALVTLRELIEIPLEGLEESA